MSKALQNWKDFVLPYHSSKVTLSGVLGIMLSSPIPPTTCRVTYLSLMAKPVTTPLPPPIRFIPRPYLGKEILYFCSYGFEPFQLVTPTFPTIPPSHSAFNLLVPTSCRL